MLQAFAIRRWLKATNEKTAPVTLVRLILAGGPLSEKQVGYAIFKLAIFSGILAIITALMMRVII
jgi:UDP-N-acetylglucosamine--dolichyl-phosphate N-acetylglucosaminephosphotransferase